MQAPTSEYVVFLQAEMKGFLLRVPDWTRTILDVDDTFPRGVVTDVKPDASVKVKTADYSFQAIDLVVQAACTMTPVLNQRDDGIHDGARGRREDFRSLVLSIRS